MKNFISKNAMVVAAMAIAAASYGLMSFGTSEQATKRWGYNPNEPAGEQWTDLTGLTEDHPGQPGDYTCESGEDICTAEFPADVNPNAPGAPNPSSVVFGAFEMIED